MLNTDIEKMQQILATSDKLALSTASNNQATVKIVNFVWFNEEPSRLYFSSVQNATGVKTYQEADCAIITIPHDNVPRNPYLRAEHVAIMPADKVHGQRSLTALFRNRGELSNGLGCYWHNLSSL